MMKRPFLWNQDARWDSLEMSYALARSAKEITAPRSLETHFRELEALLASIETKSLPPAAPEFLRLEQDFFSLAPLVGASPRYVATYVALASRMRGALKHQAEQWDMNERTARETLYRLLYGGRTAVEEVILQAPPDQRPPALLTETDEPSATPSSPLLGLNIHSGDILVSRGSVPTSALIARGNDFPGNFSHIALAHVDPVTGRLSLIEAHIEKGVAVATAEQYLGDAKLRVLVLRLRSDLPALRQDPLLPHRAASAMLRRALGAHIAYDFSMDCADSAALFCSEVASDGYRPFGVELWMGMSHLSSPGLRSWLADFGVRHWETQEPSDLEYDPQLRVVAEWRDPETLRKDHIDNAVTEAMLERAEQGERLSYSWYALPVARIVKAYSSMLNFFGAVGPIPEGMSATSALKYTFYVDKHGAAALAVRESSERFRHERGYEPPYWEMVRMARAALPRQESH
ncbi:hypothetical protein EHM92_05490 [bacterium]|nr:MAG: hypothetical protein EHM92_05490 [bacterium]